MSGYSICVFIPTNKYYVPLFQRDRELPMNLSYMVLLDMWNMFGQKFLSFIRG